LKVNDFTSLFQGTEVPIEALAISSATLSAWIGDRLPGFDKPFTVRKFKGGQSNPTYCISTEAGPYVLRRRPPGVAASSAHAIDREFKVLCALQGAGLPIPHVYFYCDDAAVIGSEFYMVEYVEGRVFWSAELPELISPERGQFLDSMNASLARLHKVDFNAVGLGNLARHEGYIQRNFERWWKTYNTSKLVEISDMDWLASALRERLPTAEPLTLIHGDFGIYNLIAHPKEARIAAILDWEMATLGNPLVDLAHTMRPWLEPPSADGSRPTLADKDLAALGLPTLGEFAARWSERSGINWTDPDFYLGYAMFRYAAMIQGILKRREDGTAANRNLVHTQDRVIAIAARARAILTQGATASLFQSRSRK
jgi:aminoglycoside phosphotransferase (APT) family kinase protein